MQKYGRNIFNFVRLIITRFGEDRCAQIAASLTFTTLLSLVPLITIALTMFSAFPVFDDFSNEIKTFLLDNLMPDKAGAVITRYMQQFAESATRLTAVGVILLTVTAMLMMLTIDQAFNVIWRVSKPRPLVKRLLIYWAVLTLAPLLVGASLSLTSWLVGLSMGYAKHIPVFGVGTLKILPVLFTALAFKLLFQLVPNRHVPSAHAWIGALVASAAFETMNRGFGYYISHFPSYKLVYGAFASIPIFLLWIYLSWLMILVGAVIAASLSYWGAPTKHNGNSPLGQMLDALHVLGVLAQGLEAGKISTLPQLSKSLRLGYDELETILEKLASVGMAQKAEGGGWLLMRDPAHLYAAELLDLFALHQADMEHSNLPGPIHQWLMDCLWQLKRNTNVSLRELLERPAV
jgi:membrane protein